MSIYDDLSLAHALVRLDAAVDLLVREAVNPCLAADRDTAGTCVGKLDPRHIFTAPVDVLCHACAAFILASRAADSVRRAQALVAGSTR